MSIHSLVVGLRVSKSKFNNVNLMYRSFSRKSNAVEGPFKVVKAQKQKVAKGKLILFYNLKW